MKPIIYLIIIAAAGYLGYNYYLEKSGQKAVEGETPAVATAGGDAPQSTPPGIAAPAKTVQVFKSKIPVPDGPPGEKHLAKPGIYYVLERTSIEHANGVAAAVPGEEVRLLARKGNGVVKVTSGKYDYELKESQITNDLDVARAAEEKYVKTHPPARQ